MHSQPGEISDALYRGRHHHELLIAGICDRNIGLHAAALIEPRRVHDTTHWNVNVVSGEALKQVMRIPTLHQQMSKGGLIKQCDAGPNRLVLGPARLEPVVAIEYDVGVRRLPGSAEPLRPLPPRSFDELRASYC